MPRKPFAFRPASAAFGLALAAALLPGTAARADGSFEYGPEAEAAFVRICAEETSATSADCWRMAEGLQARLGYEAFLSGAHQGPAAFARDAAALGASVTATAALPGTPLASR